MLDVLKAALKGGFRTSEFWLAIAALLIPVIDGAVQRVIDYLTNAQSTTHNPIYLVILTGAAAFISAAYSLARSWMKKGAIQHIPTAVALQNVATTIPNGSADAEAAHALGAGASPTDIGR